MDPRFTGYECSREPRELLVAAALDYDFDQFRCSGEIPDTRNIQSLMIQNRIRQDQWRMNACPGFAFTHALAVCYWLATGVWRTFNPLWSYRRGQEIDGIQGDNGGTIYGVTESGRRFGGLVEDVENDGKKEYPFPRDQYDFVFPSSCRALAAQRTIGYTVVLKSFRAMLNFLQAGQGAIVVGGPWGNWRPDANGVCDRFVGGGGGHARALVDWRKVRGQWQLLEPNSHFVDYGDDGFGHMTERFIDAECQDPHFIAIGISDLKLAPNDIPKQRKNRFVKLV